MATSDAAVTGRSLAKAIGDRLQHLGGRFMQSRELTLVGVVVLWLVFVNYMTPNFLVPRNILTVSTSIAIIAVAALGEAQVIFTKNIDLSVESTMGVVAYCVGNELTQQHMSVPEAWLFGLAIGVALGAVNGLIVTLLKVPSIVATLGTMAIYRGIAFFVANGRDVVLGELPEDYTNPASPVTGVVHFDFGGLPNIDLGPLSVHGIHFAVPYFVIIALVLITIVALIMKYTVLGRSMYAVGSNPEAAAMIGIRSRTTIFTAFTMCGFFAGIAGIMWGISLGGIDSSTAAGQSLVVIAAVVVGGVSIAGGSGTVVGASLGALFLGLVNKALPVMRVDPSWLNVVYGGVILLAVLAGALIQSQSLRSQARRRLP